MAVIIKILGDKIDTGVGAEEYIGAIQLKEIFDKEFNSKKEIDGTILIKPNFKAIGQSTEDIDIVVWFNLNNYTQTFSTKHQYRNEDNKYLTDLNRSNKVVAFSSLLLTIELKSHNNDGIVFSTNDVKVKYKGKLSSAYDQSIKQKYALKNFSAQHDIQLQKNNIQINNLIWFPNFTGMIPWGKCNLKNILLGTNYNFRKFIETVFESKPPLKGGNKFYQSVYNENKFDHDFDVNQVLEKVFTHYDREIKVHSGDLSRKKLENIIQKQLDGLYKEAYDDIGSKTIIINGVPGSGKTLILLRFSYFLALNRNSRSLIITYNRALTADVNRLSRLAGFKDDPSSASVQTSTCISLMRKLLIEFGIYEEESTTLTKQERFKHFKENFTNKYESLLNELIEYLEIADHEDIEKVKKEIPELNYEYISVDESQDWYSQEKDILYKLFGANNCIISYGSHQYIRNNNPLNWMDGTNSVHRLNIKTSYRQKTNLCYFIKNISNRLDLNDKIEINKNIRGGSVKIFTTVFTRYNFEHLVDYTTKTCNNAAYDVLLLVNSTDNIHKELKHNKISIHDGTIDKNKLITPTDMDACRVFNYQSSRGLEGWVVIANNLDVFIENMNNNTTEPIDGLSLKETKLKVVSRWLYMVLSRPIDTLVITFKNPNSKIATLIIEAAKEHKDFVDIN